MKATEVGKTVILATGFDMSSETSLTITVTDTNGDTATVEDSRISLAGELTGTVLGTLAANTYMLFTTLADDFIVAGDYILCGTYNDTAAVEVFFTDDATLTVEAACD